MAENSSIDQILDLLIDALEERQAERENGASRPSTPPATNEASQPTTKTTLPKAWLPFAAAAGVTCMENVTPEMITQMADTDIHLIAQSKKSKKVLMMPPEALAALPHRFVNNLPYSTRIDVEHKIATLRPTPDGQQPSADQPEREAHATDGTDEIDTSEIDDSVEVEQSAEAKPQADPAAEVESAADHDPAVDADPVVVAEPAVNADPAPQQIIVSDNLPRTLIRMFIGLLLVVVLANMRIIDFTTLNQIVGATGNDGTERIAFARDGMLLRAENTNEVYLIEDNKLRWISTAEAFNAYNYRWGAVRVVSADYLSQFEEGRPIELLLKCPSSPHVYIYTLFEKGSSTRVRRYITDIEVFNSRGYLWDDVVTNQCSLLLTTINGKPIPADYDGRIPSPNASR